MHSQPIPTLVTVNGAAERLKKNNPDSHVSAHLIRNLIKSGFPVVKTGKCFLINFDLLIDYFNGTYTFEKKGE